MAKLGGTTRILGLFVVLCASWPALAQGMDPSTEPVPEFNFAGRPVAVIVDTTLFDDGTAQLDAVEVSNVPAQPFTAGPPLLQVSYYDDTGGLIALWNTWDPRWVFDETGTGGETRNLESPADGVFHIPLSFALTRVEIVDLSTDEVLLDVDVSTEVTDFCAANPGHVSCTLETFFYDGFESP